MNRLLSVWLLPSWRWQVYNIIERLSEQRDQEITLQVTESRQVRVDGMMPPNDSQAARHTGGWIVLGGVFILACLYFRMPRPTTPSIAPGENIQLGIDVNSASESELSCIPGVGDSLARRIVEHRATYGPFQSPSQLENVPGVGPAKAAQLAEALLPLPLADQPTRIAAAPAGPMAVPSAPVTSSALPETPTGNMHD